MGVNSNSFQSSVFDRMRNEEVEYLQNKTTAIGGQRQVAEKTQDKGLKGDKIQGKYASREKFTVQKKTNQTLKWL